MYAIMSRYVFRLQKCGFGCPFCPLCDYYLFIASISWIFSIAYIFQGSPLVQRLAASGQASPYICGPQVISLSQLVLMYSFGA